VDLYTASLAFSGLVAACVVLLYAYRRIPRAPAPVDLTALQEGLLDLAEQFSEFVDKHDADMGRYHSKVGNLRRKLRKLQEEEGEFEEDYEEDAGQAADPAAAASPVLTLPTRDQAKQQARDRLKAMRGTG